jgi:hypothetical protein
MRTVAASELDSVQYFYLRELSEPRDNSLRLVVEEAVVNHSGVSRGTPELLALELASILKGASPIEPVEGCRTFEIYWKRYAAYLVTEELVGSNAANGYDDESYTGRILRLYSKSHFLNHLAQDTGGHIDPFQHYKLICLNHLIDVAAYAPPEVRLLLRSSQSSPKYASWRNIAIALTICFCLKSADGGSIRSLVYYVTRDDGKAFQVALYSRDRSVFAGCHYETANDTGSVLGIVIRWYLSLRGRNGAVGDLVRHCSDCSLCFSASR